MPIWFLYDDTVRSFVCHHLHNTLLGFFNMYMTSGSPRNRNQALMDCIHTEMMFEACKHLGITDHPCLKPIPTYADVVAPPHVSPAPREVGMVSEKAAVADNAATEKAAAAEKAAHMKAWDLAVRRDKAAAGSPKLLPIEIRRREAMETAQKIRLSVEAEKAAKKACEKIKKAEEQAVARKKQLAIKAAKKLARNQAKKKAELAKTKAEQRALETDKHAKAIPSEAPSEPRMPEPTSEKHGQTTGEVVAASMLHLRLS